MDTAYAPHCIYRIRYHIVICLKYRKRLLTEGSQRDRKKILLQPEKVIREYIERHGTKEEKENFKQMKLFDL